MTKTPIKSSISLSAKDLNVDPIDLITAFQKIAVNTNSKELQDVLINIKRDYLK